MIRFVRDGKSLSLAADDADAIALTSLAAQFTDLLAERDSEPIRERAAPTDPALVRLFPDPVPTDPVESAEVRTLTEPALLEHKRVNAMRVTKSLAAPGPLDPADELAWLQWLTDIRLVLAARIGILVDGDEGRSTTDADRAMQWSYHALGALQADLLDALDARESARRTRR